MSSFVDFQIIYTPDEEGFSALEPITGTTSWGETISEAKEMITEALELYFSELTEEEASEQLREATGSVTGAIHVHVAA